MYPLNERIRQLRKQKNLSQVDLANKLKTTNDTVSLWEIGKRNPSVEDLKELCLIFNVTADYLLGLTDIY